MIQKKVHKMHPTTTTTLNDETTEHTEYTGNNRFSVFRVLRGSSRWFFLSLMH